MGIKFGKEANIVASGMFVLILLTVSAHAQYLPQDMSIAWNNDNANFMCFWSMFGPPCAGTFDCDNWLVGPPGGSCENCETWGGIWNGTTYTFPWEDTNIGNPNCCGDDTGENYRACNDFIDNINSCVATDDACCDNEYDCVFGGNCYTGGSVYTIGSGDDSMAYCSDGIGLGLFVDCDTTSSFCSNCNLNWVSEGESSSIGEYGDGSNYFSLPPPWLTDTCDPVTQDCIECCGDDDGEYYWYRHVSSTNPPPWGHDASDDACCNARWDCIYNGNCFTTNFAYTEAELGGSWMDDDYVVCDRDTLNDEADWFDCDYSTTKCNFCDSKAGWSGERWIASGEEGVGQYDSGGVTECCGDDDNEYYEICSFPPFPQVAWSCSGADACCDTSTDCVSNDGVCYTSGDAGAGLNVGGYDNVAKCLEFGPFVGSWNDCDVSISSCGTCADELGCSDCWVAGGESSGFGEYDTGTSTECCGDDAGEAYAYFKSSYNLPSSCDDITDEACMNGGDDSSDVACCDDDDDCIYGGTCYAEGTYRDLDGDGRVDGWCMRSDAWKTHWRDCDDASGPCEGACASNWVAGGESAQFGEYDTGIETECCGDDASEYYGYYNEAVDSCDPVTDGVCIGLGDSSSDEACCNLDEDCVYNGECYLGSAMPVGLATISNTLAFCYLGGWYDCDHGETNCEVNCGQNWTTGGESLAFGEYDTGTSTECCGDDPGEYYGDHSAVMGGSAIACCDSSTGCVNASGDCLDSFSIGCYDDSVYLCGITPSWGLSVACDAGTCNSGCGYYTDEQNECIEGSGCIPNDCSDCGYYAAAVGSCTTTCSVSCGAPCDSNDDCDGLCDLNSCGCYCTQNADCDSGSFCNSDSICIATIPHDGACDITLIDTELERDGACEDGDCFFDNPNYICNQMPSAPVQTVVENISGINYQLLSWTASADPDEESFYYKAFVRNGFNSVIHNWTYLSSALSSQNATDLDLKTSYTWNLSACDVHDYCTGWSTDTFYRDNYIPSIDDANITPLDAYTDSLLSCTYQNWTDSDGDAEVPSYVWYQNTTPFPIADQITSTLDCSVYCSKNTTITCQITPNDGEASGIARNVTVEIQNSLPELTTNPAINKSVLATDDVVNCDGGTYYDADGDAKDSDEWRWYVNADLRASTQTFDLGFIGNGEAGDFIHCEQRVYDNEEYSIWYASASKTVASSTPYFTSQTVDSSTSANPTDVHMNVTFTATAADPDTDNYKLLVCFTNVVSGTACEQNQKICESVYVENGIETSCSYNVTSLPLESYEWYSFVCDELPLGECSSYENTSSPFYVNHKPVVDPLSITISPASPYTTDDLTCDVTLSDGDSGDTVSASFLWTLAGDPVGTDQQLNSSETSKGDSIRCRATSVDNHGLVGDWEESSIGIVFNTPPLISSVYITPAVAYANSTLNCITTGWYDADGDSEDYTYLWFNDSELLEFEDPSGTFDCTGYCAKGSSITCQVIPYDGEESGEPLNATVTIRNSVPVVTDVNITPYVAYTNDTLYGVGTFYDLDNDANTSTYLWYVAGVEAGDSISLNPQNFSKDDTITFYYIPNDGEVNGTSESAEITIVDMYPELSGVSLTPEISYKRSNLTCTPIGWDDLDDDPPRYQYLWFNNSILINASFSSEINSKLNCVTFGGCEKGDNITCEVTPTLADNTTVGTAINDTLMIANSPPVVENLTIEPAEPYTNDTLSCQNITTSDDDSDAVSVSYSWYKNGDDVWEWESTLESSNFVHYDTLICMATPSDVGGQGTSKNTTVTIQNTLSIAQYANVTPSYVYADTILTCTSYAQDIDDDGISFSYRWFMNSSTLAGQTNQSINCSLAGCRKSYNLTCEATPQDQGGDGTAVNETIVIQNSKPAIFYVSISPSPAYDNDTFECNNGTVSDIDDDSVSFYYHWYKDTVLQLSLTNATVNNTYLSDNETWSCGMMPYDGEENGSMMTSAEVSIGSTNTAPVIVNSSSDSTSTDPISVGDNITFAAYWYDNQSDSVVLHVCDTGFAIPSGCTGISLCNISDDSDSPTTCDYEAREDDDTSNTAYSIVCDQFLCSMSYSVDFEVNHMPQLVSTPSIMPVSAYTNSNLTCLGGFSDSDDDYGDITFRWFRNSTLLNTTSSNLSSGNFGKGDNIVCEQVPFDHHGFYGNAMNSTVLTILNSPPLLASIGPQNPLVEIPYLLIVDASDADNENLTFSTNSSLLTINSTTGRMELTAANDSAGNYYVNISSSDGSDLDYEIVHFVISTWTDYLLPYVTDVVASPSSAFVGSPITISANVTDDIAVRNVTANITLPDATTQLVILNNTGSLYSVVFEDTGLAGDYLVNITASDYSGKVNGTENTSFYMALAGGVTTVPTTVVTTIIPSRETTVESTSTVETTSTSTVTTSTSTLTTSTVSTSTTTTLIGDGTCYHICLSLYNTSESRCYDRRSCKIVDPAGTWVHESDGDWDCDEANSNNPFCCCPVEIVTTTSTTTTLPAGCYETCAVNFNSRDSQCYSGPDCAIPDSDWSWEHGRAGDWDCEQANPDSPYCCCPISGNFIRLWGSEDKVTCDNGILDRGEAGVDCGGPCSPCERRIVEIRTNYADYVYPNETFTFSAEITALEPLEDLRVVLNISEIFHTESTVVREIARIEADSKTTLIWDITALTNVSEGTYLSYIDVSYSNATLIASDSFSITVIEPVVVKIPFVGEIVLPPLEVVQDRMFNLINNFVRSVYRSTILWLSLILILFALGYVYYRGRSGGGRKSLLKSV